MFEVRPRTKQLAILGLYERMRALAETVNFG